MFKSLFPVKSPENGLVSEIDEIYEILGDVLYEFGHYSYKSSLVGRYQLPIVPKEDGLIVGGWLKIPVKMDLLPKGVFLEDLQDERLLSALRVALRRNVEVRFAPLAAPASIIFEKPSKVKKDDYHSQFEFWYFVELDQSRLRGIPRLVRSSQVPDYPPDMFLPVPLGVSVADTFQWFDFARDFVALLVAGVTGSGKSTFLRHLFHFYSSNFSPDYFRGFLADFKEGVEFSEFSDFPHYSVFTEVDPFLDLIEFERARRFGLFRHCKVRDIFQYNAVVSESERLPYVIVAIDEFAAVSLKGGKKAVERSTLLVAQTRAAGLFWLVSTQRPSTDIIVGSLKTNLPARVSFSQAMEVDSEVVFGEGVTNAKQLGCPGRAWCLVSDKFFEFQAPFIE